MAQEQKRGCGYRKVGGIYLVGSYISISCDRLPFPLKSCPVCGAGMHFTRAMTEINPLKLFGTHDTQVPVFKDNPDVAGTITKVNCFDKFRPCYVCDPSNEPAYLMMVGEKFYPTPEHFMNEAMAQGISKRIPFIPKNFKVGRTIIYLAHNKACVVKEPVAVQQAMQILKEQQPRMIDTSEKETKSLGIFSAFIPQRIEMPVWESELTDDKRKDLMQRGITPIPLKDGDKDHSK